jgi:hypothetical protein
VAAAPVLPAATPPTTPSPPSTSAVRQTANHAPILR